MINFNLARSEQERERSKTFGVLKVKSGKFENHQGSQIFFLHIERVHRGGLWYIAMMGAGELGEEWRGGGATQNFLKRSKAPDSQNITIDKEFATGSKNVKIVRFFQKKIP